MNDKNVLIEFYYEKGFKSNEIVEELRKEGFEVEPATIRKHISRKLKHLKEAHESNCKKKNAAKFIIEDLYKKGFNYNEIAEELRKEGFEVESATIRKHISRKLKYLKETHEQNSKKRKEAKKEDERLLRRENNNFMSVRDFVMRNINCYDQKKDGSYVFNGKSGAATWDTPLKYSVNI